jgi:hypothetical protein
MLQQSTLGPIHISDALGVDMQGLEPFECSEEISQMVNNIFG